MIAEFNPSLAVGGKRGVDQRGEGVRGIKMRLPPFLPTLKNRVCKAGYPNVLPSSSGALLATGRKILTEYQPRPTPHSLSFSVTFISWRTDDFESSCRWCSRPSPTRLKSLPQVTQSTVNHFPTDKHVSLLCIPLYFYVLCGYLPKEAGCLEEHDCSFRGQLSQLRPKIGTTLLLSMQLHYCVMWSILTNESKGKFVVEWQQISLLTKQPKTCPEWDTCIDETLARLWRMTEPSNVQ